MDYREWNMNPNTITFKKSLSDAEGIAYGVNDISGFGINRLEKFVLYNGPITMDSTDPDKVANMGEDDRDTSSRMAAVFLKEIEKGTNIALYSYRDELKIRYFLADAPLYRPKELIYRLTKRGPENTFRKQLSAELVRNGKLNDDMIIYISKTEYNADNLLYIINRINHISKATYNKSHHSGPVLDFFAGAAMNIVTTSPWSQSSYYAAGGRAYTSYKPGLLLGINVFANPATRQLQFRLEASADESSYRSLYTEKVYPYQPTEASFDATSFSFSPQVIYNFYNADKLKAFLGIGLNAQFVKYSHSYLGSQNHDGSQSDIAANNPYYFISSNDGVICKAGVQVGKNLQLFADYSDTIPVTSGGYFALSSNAIRVGAVYLIDLK
ncbi:MAG: hypothetical protein JST19_03010 [Bacteroidetes bacterium]|nr:hypothetical protein [Bacteroidota bacterium]